MLILKCSANSICSAILKCGHFQAKSSKLLIKKMGRDGESTFLPRAQWRFVDFGSLRKKNRWQVEVSPGVRQVRLMEADTFTPALIQHSRISPCYRLQKYFYSFFFQECPSFLTHLREVLENGWNTFYHSVHPKLLSILNTSWLIHHFVSEVKFIWFGKKAHTKFEPEMEWSACYPTEHFILTQLNFFQVFQFTENFEDFHFLIS